MKVTLLINGADVQNLDVHEDMDLESFKALVGAELNKDIQLLKLFFNNVELKESEKSLGEYGVKEGDLLVLNFQNTINTQQQGGYSFSQQSGRFEAIRQQILGDASLRKKLEGAQPELVHAAEKGSAEFASVYSKFEEQRAVLERERAMELAKLEADPFNIEAQRKIENIIKDQNIMKNMEDAMEHNPESFGQVHMLYINMAVNGHPVKAFVDSGAQSTIMSPSCAEACGLMRLLDTRFAGVARGVGTAKILGRVHSAPIRIGNSFYPCSFMVMEGKDVDMLFGLDMLKRHQACIDLKLNALVISGENIPFLPEHEIPKSIFNEAEVTESISKSSGAPSSAPSITAAPTIENTFPEESIKNLMELGGITREHACALLKQTNGNLDLAADILLS